MTSRLLPSLFLQLIALVWAWNFVIASFGQGAHYLVAGWWASLLGLTMLGMGLMPLLAGLLLGLVATLFFRTPHGAPLSDDATFALIFRGAGLHLLAYFAAGVVLWQLAPATPNENAAYDGSFVAVALCVALGFGLLASIATSLVVARRGLPTAA
jgi:hypothetical protein